MLGSVAIVLIFAFLVYVRFSPLPETRWHVPVPSETNADFSGGAVRILAGDATVLARMARAVEALPRTRLLAGSVEQGHVTYVTRSALFGFPDMTTLQLHDTHVALYGRLRFGASDLGVNRKRLERVIGLAQGG